jgi:hypothetical protein
MGVCFAGWAVVTKYTDATFIHRNPMIHLAALCVLLGFNAFFFGLLAEVLIRMNFAIQKKEPYRVRQIRGLEQRTPHIGASQTPPDPEPESATPTASGPSTGGSSDPPAVPPPPPAGPDVSP